jgi:hypothetical protein
MSELKINGKIKLMLDVQTFDSGFTKREFVVTTLEQYPQDIKLEVTQDRVSLLNSLKVNDVVDVSFNVRGNEYNGRYFVNLQAWKIEASAETSTPPAPQEDDGDLPF